MNIIPILQNKRVLLGVSGSIAAYKSVELASRLTQVGALVDVVLTHSATQFVTALTFQSVTGREVFTDADLWNQRAHVLHVTLGEHSDVVLVAPATANTLAKLAHGLADNALTIALLVARGPVLVAPAMDGGMFQHPSVQANLKTLQERGVMVIGPAEGRMASGLTGMGRMMEPPDLLGHVRLALGRRGILHGKHIVVTAAGTREAIDPVRYISNHSSGKQGFALAQAALDRGARVTLVTGPAHLPTPVGVERINVESAAEMAAAVLQASENAEALIMAAAVADFRPARVAEHKIKKTTLPTIELERTEDILTAVADRRAHTRKPTVVVGFAAESENLIENAREKVFRKNLSLIVANDISEPNSGFNVDTNRVTLIGATGGVDQLPMLSKAMVADAVMERVAKLLGR